MGTRLNGLTLIKVVDGDTLRVELHGADATLRLLCLDTEESFPGGSKPVTNAGKEATRLARKHFGCKEDDGLPLSSVKVDIEFDTSDPEHVCFVRHRGSYERLLCYVYKSGGENYNLKAVRDGLSPYFVKYGRSRLYHKQFLAAEAKAQSSGLMIWNPATNAGVEGNGRDYASLVPWWNLRDSVVADYREQGLQAGVVSVRLDYADLVTASLNGDSMTVLCDLQGGVGARPGTGAVLFAGSRTQPFNLWIPDRTDTDAQAILRLVKLRYAGAGRGYVYVSGKATTYNGKPQIVLTDLKQLSDSPPP